MASAFGALLATANPSAGSSPFTYTLGSAVTAGDRVIIEVSCFGLSTANHGTIAITVAGQACTINSRISTNNSWSQALASVVAPGGGFSSGDTVSVTWSAAPTFSTSSAWSFTGTSAFDTSQQRTTTLATGAWSTTTITPAANGALVAAATRGSSGASATAGTGYTEINDYIEGAGSNSAHHSVYRTSGTIASTGYTPGGTWGGTGTYWACAVAFTDTAGGTSLTLTPGAANTNWAGSTPSVAADKALTPAAGAVTWSGSTPTLTGTNDLTLTPGAATVAWQGSTPSTAADITRQPGTPDVAWSGSTPAVLLGKTLQPAAAEVLWSGSTPTVILEGAVTLSPGAADTVWSGSTPAVRIVPDVTPEEPSHGGDGGDGDLGDISTVEVRNLTLHPGAAVVRWTSARPTVRVAFEPLRVRLPKRRVVAVQPVPESLPVRNLTLQPQHAAVAWKGSRAQVSAASYVEESKYLRALERIEALEAELEQRAEEEALMLAALSD